MTQLFPTTVVGSMPRPLFVRELLRPATRETLGDKEFTRRLDTAVAYVVAMQEAAGIDIYFHVVTRYPQCRT